MQNIRPDFIFSYWVFVWSFLYFINIVTISPKLCLILVIIENIFSIFMNVDIIQILFYFTFYKLYLLRKEPIQKKNVLYSGIVFMIYNLWLFINGQNVYTIYKIIYNF